MPFLPKNLDESKYLKLNYSYRLWDYLAYAMDQEADNSEIDPIWTSSRTARQIYALGEVDKVLCL